jgi:hypothetical protein
MHLERTENATKIEVKPLRHFTVAEQNQSILVPQLAQLMAHGPDIDILGPQASNELAEG